MRGRWRRCFWVESQQGAEGLGEYDEGDVAVPAGEGNGLALSCATPVGDALPGDRLAG